MKKIQYAMKSPVGTLYLVASQDALHGLFFKQQHVPLVTSLGTSQPEEKMLNKTIRQLEEYFAGTRKEFDIVFELAGTSFQKRVWKELSNIPFGKTIAYKDLANKIKNPKAVRAVGSANGRNPVSIIIPCHRVIAADGSLGGYGGGLPMKQKLLKLEGSEKF